MFDVMLRVSIMPMLVLVFCVLSWHMCLTLCFVLALCRCSCWCFVFWIGLLVLVPRRYIFVVVCCGGLFLLILVAPVVLLGLVAIAVFCCYVFAVGVALLKFCCLCFAVRLLPGADTAPLHLCELFFAVGLLWLVRHCWIF